MDRKKVIPYVIVGVVLVIGLVIALGSQGALGIGLFGSAGSVSLCTTNPQLCIGGPPDWLCGEIPDDPLCVADTGSSSSDLLCGLWQPDVGDAEEKGLIGSQSGLGNITILISTSASIDGVVATIDGPYQGDNFFQVPEEYRHSKYFFKIATCGKWHTGEDVGFFD